MILVYRIVYRIGAEVCASGGQQNSEVKSKRGRRNSRAGEWRSSFFEIALGKLIGPWNDRRRRGTILCN